MPVNFVIPYTSKSPRLLYSAVLPGVTSIVLFTCPANTKYSDISVTFSNTTANTVNVTLIANGSYLVRSRDIPPYDTLVIPFETVLNAGATIQGAAGTASAINCTIVGNEVT